MGGVSWRWLPSATAGVVAALVVLLWPGSRVWGDDLADLYRLALQRDPALQEAALTNRATQSLSRLLLAEFAVYV